jgi:uncharacterized protein YkwD
VTRARTPIILLLVALAAVALGPAAGVAGAHSGAAKRTHAARCSHPRVARHCATSRTLAYAHSVLTRKAKHASTHGGTHGSSRRSAAAEARATLSETLSQVLATPCQNTQLTPDASNGALVRAAVLCLINRERAQNGELPLREDPKLDASAEAHVQDMLAKDYFEHISPGGSTPVDRDRESRYIPSASVGYVVGENLAWGTLSLSTPQAIVAAWIASPGHLANIVESQYRDTGIAIAPQVPSSLASDVAGATYAQEFGAITH